MKIQNAISLAWYLTLIAASANFGYKVARSVDYNPGLGSNRAALVTDGNYDNDLRNAAGILVGTVAAYIPARYLVSELHKKDEQAETQLRN